MQTTTPKKDVSVIIAALNEEPTVANVIKEYLQHPRVAEVIVVSDGSTDKTAQRARETGAIVIEFPENRGKGDAMAAGVERAQHDLLLFSDADLIGLNQHMISLLIRRVEEDGYDMYSLIRDRVTESFQLYFPAHYSVGGERILRRSLWNMVPPEDRQGFEVELALNYYAYRSGLVMGYERVPGLLQVSKEQKRGLIAGLIAHVDMFFQCMRVFFRLHVMKMAAA
jgi:polyisoprenyl-phosphate glycosyltransferase